MTLMCTGCYEKVEFYNIKMNEKFHPYNVGTCDCGGKVCVIDELILPAIQILNKKGWTTEYCCSGHLDESLIATYIKFKHHPQSAPVGFIIDEDCIRAKNRFRKLSGLAGFRSLSIINQNLYKWALELPENS